MSTNNRNWATGFYWLGMLMTLACLAFVLMGNTAFAYSFEHQGFPLSWAFGLLAVFAFLAAELCHPADTFTSEVEQGSSEQVLEWESVEV